MKQRKWWLSIMVVGMFSSAALAISPMGPPVSMLAEGQYAAGLGYAMSEQTLEISGPASTTGDAELDDIQSSVYYGCLGYGISDAWSIYAAIGLSDAEFDADSGGSDFDGDTEFGFAVGTKRTLHDNESGTKWGTIFQYCRGQSEDKISNASTFGNDAFSVGAGRKVELDWYEMQLALGPAIQMNEELCLYGGPFLHFAEGDVEVQGSQNEYELEQRVELGGYIGALMSLGANASLSLEFLITGEAWGVGIGAMIGL